MCEWCSEVPVVAEMRPQEKHNGVVYFEEMLRCALIYTSVIL